GALQARVTLDSGQFTLTGPDLRGAAHANVITFFAPTVRVAGKSFPLQPIRDTKKLANGLELTCDLGGTTLTAQLTFPRDNVMKYEIVRWNGIVAEQTMVTVTSDGGEHFFGFGEKFDSLDQAGKRVRTLDRKSTRLNSSHEWISYA